MPTFRYKGQTAGGAKVSGVLRAGRCQDKFAVLPKNIKVRRGEPEGEDHIEKGL